jgi:hypothetical protein
MRAWGSLPDVSTSSPYEVMRTLLEALPLDALKHVIRTLEVEDPIPDDTLESSYAVTWEMLERIHQAGITVGSHTKNHAVMTNEAGDRVMDELVGSRQELERRLGVPVRHFAYPGGRYNAASVSAVAAAEYRFGYTGCAHRSTEHPLLTVPRTILWEHSCVDANRAFSEEIMSCQVHRAFDLVAGCRQSHAAPQGSTSQVYGNASI